MLKQRVRGTVKEKDLDAVYSDTEFYLEGWATRAAAEAAKPAFKEWVDNGINPQHRDAAAASAAARNEASSGPSSSGPENSTAGQSGAASGPRSTTPGARCSIFQPGRSLPALR